MIKHQIPNIEQLRAKYESLDKSQLIEMLIQNNLNNGILAEKGDESYMMEIHKTWYDGQPIDRTPTFTSDTTPIVMNATFEMPPMPPLTMQKVY